MTKNRPSLGKRLRRQWDFIMGYAACKCRFCHVTFSAAEEGHSSSPLPHQPGAGEIDICPDCADEFVDCVKREWEDYFRSWSSYTQPYVAQIPEVRPIVDYAASTSGATVATSLPFRHQARFSMGQPKNETPWNYVNFPSAVDEGQSDE